MAPKLKLHASWLAEALGAILRDSDKSAVISVSLDEHQDLLSQGIVVVDTQHHEIHEGDHFFYHDFVSLNNNGTQDYLITVPNTTKRCHVILELEGSAITQFQLFEGTDKNGTTIQTTFNSDRQSSKTAGMTIHKATNGGTTDGSQIMIHKGGSASNQSRGPSEVREENEIILRPGTKYILRVTSGTDSNLIDVSVYWYEHITGEK